MRKNKLIPCLVISFLIHLGVLVGIDVSLIPTPGVPEWPDLIPVDMVIVEEEEEPSSSPTLKETEFSKDALIAKAQTAMGTPGLTSLEDFPDPIPKESTFKPTLNEEKEESSSSPAFNQTETVKDALVAKAQTAMGTPGPTSLEDFPGPIPKEGAFKPSLNVEHIPTPGVLPMGQEGEEVESRRVVSRSVNSSLQLPAIPHSPVDQSPLHELEEPRVLTRAEKGGVPIYSTTLEKATAPLGRNRPHPEFVSDLPPIPTVSSPTLPEEREMILARHEESVQSHIDNSTVLTPVSGAKEPKKQMAENHLDELFPEKMASLEPLTIGREREMIAARRKESLQPHISKSETLRASRVLKETEEKIRDNRWDILFSKKTASLEPLMTGFDKRGTFEGPEKGYSILLVLDTSGSVKGPPLEGIKKSAMEFVGLLGEMDRCAVITFNDEATLVVPFTSDKNRLRQAIANLLTKGKNTVLFDALDQAFLLLKKERDRRRFVVLFSDGKDEGSQSTPYEVIDRARGSNISVFCLGYSRVERRYLSTLESLSRRTGGIFAEAPHFGEIVELFSTARHVRDNKGS